MTKIQKHPINKWANGLIVLKSRNTNGQSALERHSVYLSLRKCRLELFGGSVSPTQNGCLQGCGCWRHTERNALIHCSWECRPRPSLWKPAQKLPKTQEVELLCNPLYTQRTRCQSTTEMVAREMEAANISINRWIGKEHMPSMNDLEWNFIKPYWEMKENGYNWKLLC